jgi:nucleotide-binding universal stress UspA family protein
MNRAPQKPSNLVVGVDFSDLSALALSEALLAARGRKRCHIHVLHAIQQSHVSIPSRPIPTGSRQPPPSAEMQAMAVQTSDELRRYTEKVFATVADDEPPAVERLTTHVSFLDPAHALAQLASDVEADLVVVGTHGRGGLARLLLGSVAGAVVRLAPCPVLVVRPKRETATDVPRIEAPCAKCLETRLATEGKEFWCAQHREHHAHAHTYSFSPVRSGHQSGLLLPI